MYIKNNLEFRYLRMTDDLELVGELLYDTDPFIYPAFLGDKVTARIILAEAIRCGVYCFKTDTLFCAFKNGMPIGVICANPNGEYKWTYEEWKEMFNDKDIKLPDTFDIVANGYFEDINKESFDDSIYVLAVCVSKEMRSQGIAKEMFVHFLNQHHHKRIILDCLKNNPAAIALYESAGFIKCMDYIGFNVKEPYPRCVRMIKER